MYWILSHGFMQWTSSKAFYRVLCVVVENKNTCSGNGVSRVFLEQRSVDHVHATLLKEPCIVIGTSLLNWSKHWSHKKSSSSLIPTFCASPVQPSQQRILKTALSMSEMDGKFLCGCTFLHQWKASIPPHHPRQMASPLLVPAASLAK